MNSFSPTIYEELFSKTRSTNLVLTLQTLFLVDAYRALRKSFSYSHTFMNMHSIHSNHHTHIADLRSRCTYASAIK